MKFILTTHNVSTSEAIEDHILSKIEKLEHLDQRAVETRVAIEFDKTRSPEKQFKCSVRLAVRGPDLYAEDVEADLYPAIDLAFKKIQQQIRTLHNKRKEVKKRVGAKLKEQRREGNAPPLA
jgi:putative sigma-54 modulation protein